MVWLIPVALNSIIGILIGAWLLDGSRLWSGGPRPSKEVKLIVPIHDVETFLGGGGDFINASKKSAKFPASPAGVQQMGGLQLDSPIDSNYRGSSTCHYSHFGMRSIYTKHTMVKTDPESTLYYVGGLSAKAPSNIMYLMTIS